MSSILRRDLPSEALLSKYAATGSYTDCYTVVVPLAVALPDYVAAFYTTPVFKLERWLISRALGLKSTDADVRLLASSAADSFSAWRVEARGPDQLLVATGRTRSWFMVVLQPDGVSTSLFFGSAVVPRAGGGMGALFHALLGFHRLYSRILLRSAVWRLGNNHQFPGGAELSEGRKKE